MSKNTSITLGDHYEKFIDQQINAGQFGTVSEAVRSGLRLLEEREMRRDALRAALEEGARSGIAKDFSFEKLNKKLDKKFNKK